MTSESLLVQTADLAVCVLDDVRISLMSSLRFMDVALWRMPLATKRIARPLATDGYLLYLSPVSVIRAYRADANEVLRDYLHVILHCIFRHPFDDKHPDARLWDLACDIAVESCALELVGLRYPSALDARRRSALSALKDAAGALTAQKLYKALVESEAVHAGLPVETTGTPLTRALLQSLPELFVRDDHATWTRTPERPPAQMTFDDDVEIIGSGDEHLRGERAEEVDEDEENSDPGVDMPGVAAPSSGGSAVEGEVEGGDRLLDVEAHEQGEESFASMHGVESADFADISWTDISKLIEVDLEAFTGRAGIDAGTFEVNLSVANRKVYDFRDFLKRFSALSEEMKVSTEEFDYIYYTYGLSRYGNMPLVEPLEYQESRRIREFVIAIDTSASCAGGLVKHFIEKTYDVLRSQAAFGRKVNVHVVQCDCEVRKDTKITSVRDLDGEFGEFTARGFGGTDFRPVFKYVNDLVESRELPNLKGMIYLTDGIGKYPEEPPEYDCAFVFVNDDGAARKVPPWAMKVMMTEDEILEL